MKCLTSLPFPFSFGYLITTGRQEEELSETANKVKELEQTSKETHASVKHVTQQYKQSREEDEKRLRRQEEDLSETADKVKELEQTSVETSARVERVTQEQKKLVEDTKEKFEQLKSSKRSLECLEEKVAHVSQEHKRMKLEDEEKAQHLEHKVDTTRDSLLETKAKVEQLEQSHKRKVQGKFKETSKIRKGGNKQGKKPFQTWCAYIEFCKFSAGLKVLCFSRSHVKPPLPRGGSACECVWGWRASPPLPPSHFLGDPSLEMLNVTPLPFLVWLSDHNTTPVIECFGSLSYYTYIYNMPKVPN